MPDRVPVAPFVQEEYLGYHYPQKTRLDRVVDAVELAESLDFDLMAKHRAFETPHFFRRSQPHWELRRSEAREGGMIRRRLEVVTPKRTLVREEVGPDCGTATQGVRFHVSRCLIQDADDLDAFLTHLPPLDDAEHAEMRATVALWRSILGDRGVLAPWGFAGVFNCCADLCGQERIFAMPSEDAAGYRALMDGIATAMCHACTALGAAGIDAIGIQGHMAGGSTAGPRFFRTCVQPYEQRVIDAIHAAGARSIYHNCGSARSLYASYRELGMTVWETIAEHPRGDNRLAEAKSVLGDRICLLGNLDQVDFLKRATPGEVASRTEAIMQIGKPGGRFIFSTSDYLEKDTPLANVRAMIAAAKQSGVYA
jgi:hypothetical protein